MYIASVTTQPEFKQQHTIHSSEQWQERISSHVPHKEVVFLDQEVNNTPMPAKKGILGGHFHLNFGMIQSTATCKML